jgi:NodT family efflux transporter outer membrane factor (OMF) lipoprotein
LSPRRAVLWLTSSLVGGCAVAPAAHPPGLPAPAAGHFTAVSPTADPSAEPPADWWRLYDSAELAGLVAEALAANTDLRMALAHLAQARAVEREARSGRYPSTQLGAGAVYGRNLIADSIAGVLHKEANNQTTTLLGFDMAYELDLYGRVAGSIAESLADAQAVEAAADMVRVVVAAETTRAWAGALSAGHELAVARRSVQIADEAVAIVARQVGAGAASSFDLARVHLLAEQARSQLPLLEGRRRAAGFELAALLGRAPSDELGHEGESPRITTALPVGDGAQLLARRPDVRQAERRVAAAGARVGVATASLYPRVSLGANLGLASNGVLRGPNAVNFAIGPLVSWSFPDQAAARARIAQSNAAAAAALAGFDGTVLRALKEVEQAITACDAETERRKALAAAQAQAAEAYRLSALRRREGAASQLDVLNAEQTLLGTRAAVAAADSRIVDAQITLFKALGGGWQRPAAAAE